MRFYVVKTSLAALETQCQLIFTIPKAAACCFHSGGWGQFAVPRQKPEDDCLRFRFNLLFLSESSEGDYFSLPRFMALDTRSQVDEIIHLGLVV